MTTSPTFFSFFFFLFLLSKKFFPVKKIFSIPVIVKTFSRFLFVSLQFIDLLVTTDAWHFSFSFLANTKTAEPMVFQVVSVLSPFESCYLYSWQFSLQLVTGCPWIRGKYLQSKMLLVYKNGISVMTFVNIYFIHSTFTFDLLGGDEGLMNSHQ